MKPVHQRLNLYIDGNETYTFVPVEPVGARSLTIYRNSGDVVLNAPNTPLPANAERSVKTIYGIYGMISLAMSEYIIVITGRELRGHIMRQNIYRATEYDILPLNPDVSVQSPPNVVESHLLALVQSHLQGGTFFFSYGWDITRRLQAQWMTLQEDGDKALWEIADDRFFWNKFLQNRFIDITSTNPDQNLSAYILPVIYGTFDIRPVQISIWQIRLGLISRRSRYRAGTRFFRRGVDSEGRVANFNETEQVLLVGGDESGTQLSFVQIRGSIPVYWAEVNTLRYKPDVQIMELQDTVNALRAHLQENLNLYGGQTLVNLVNQTGHEKPVKEAFEKHMAESNMPKTKYEYFDFHSECSKMRWDRIGVLIGKLEEELVQNGYFQLASNKPEPVKLQTGVVRTNCMDNLDRTNVAQSAIAKWMLNRQLKELRVIQENDSIDNYDELTRDFREMWTDHANFISIAYSGTGALKTDFTRTGKRTRQGLFEDGWNSVVRYLKNNFFDGARQDAFDLMTGTWWPRRGWNPATLVVDRRPLVIRAPPYILLFSLFMICAGLTLPRTSDYSLLYYFLLWISLVVVTTAFIFIHGIDYVSWPRLLPPTDIIYYDGPGFRSAHHGKGLGLPALEKAQASVGEKEHRRARSKKLDEIEMGSVPAKEHFD
ncbi:SacI homology domain-containing protein [Ganoderma leucocontextum]|nr:SacI homology domain-containing protein [Ganoderma leucocontextum]